MEPDFIDKDLLLALVVVHRALGTDLASDFASLALPIWLIRQQVGNTVLSSDRSY